MACVIYGDMPINQIPLALPSDIRINSDQVGINKTGNLYITLTFRHVSNRANPHSKVRKLHLDRWLLAHSLQHGIAGVAPTNGFIPVFLKIL